MEIKIANSSQYQNVWGEVKMCDINVQCHDENQDEMMMIQHDDDDDMICVL